VTVRAVDTWVVPVIDLAATGQRIKSMRQAAGISVRDLQTILGFTSPQAIYKWQHGECMPTIDNLVILASVFGVTVDEILVVEGESPDDGEAALISPITTGISVQW
jgi:transcriptional regulator with XRE-family HTH domain